MKKGDPAAPSLTCLVQGLLWPSVTYCNDIFLSSKHPPLPVGKQAPRKRGKCRFLISSSAALYKHPLMDSKTWCLFGYDDRWYKDHGPNLEFRLWSWGLKFLHSVFSCKSEYIKIEINHTRNLHPIITSLENEYRSCSWRMQLQLTQKMGNMIECSVVEIPPSWSGACILDGWISSTLHSMMPSIWIFNASSPSVASFGCSSGVVSCNLSFSVALTWVFEGSPQGSST